MDMPITERRLNIRFIREHLEEVEKAKNPDQQLVTADRPLITNPMAKMKEEAPTYVSKVKKRR